jgi:hypothetical protein
LEAYEKASPKSEKIIKRLNDGKQGDFIYCSSENERKKEAGFRLRGLVKF